MYLRISPILISFFVTFWLPMIILLVHECEHQLQPDARSVTVPAKECCFVVESSVNIIIVVVGNAFNAFY